MSINDRLCDILVYLHISRHKFFTNCGLAGGNILPSALRMRDTTLLKIWKIYPELSLTWLLTGKGNMIMNDADRHTTEEEALQEIHQLIGNTTYMKARIRDFAVSQGYNNNTFEQAIGVSHGYLSKDGAITESKLQRIKQLFPMLNTEWVITGFGEMITDEKPKPALPFINEKKKTKQEISIESLMDIIDKQQEYINILTEKLKDKNKDE